MNPMIVLSAVVAAASAAPSNYGPVAAAPAVAYGQAPLGYAQPAPLGYAQPAPLAVNLPAPYSTQEVAGPPVTTIHQAPAVHTKQVHLGATTYVSGQRTEIYKPPTPVLPIAVSTNLKGTQTYNAPLVKTVAEVHTVNQPIPVERRVNVPYDAPVLREQIVKVPTPVHVRQPYAVPVPTPVQGETIVNHHQGAPIVQREHTNIIAQPAVAYTQGYAAQGYAAAAPVGYANAGYAAAAPLGYANAGYAGQGYAAATPVGYAGQGYAGQGYATAGYAGQGYAAATPVGYAGQGYAAAPVAAADY